MEPFRIFTGYNIASWVWPFARIGYVHRTRVFVSECVETCALPPFAMLQFFTEPFLAVDFDLLALRAQEPSYCFLFHPGPVLGSVCLPAKVSTARSVAYVSFSFACAAATFSAVHTHDWNLSGEMIADFITCEVCLG